MKLLNYAGLALLAGLTLASCDKKDDDTITPDTGSGDHKLSVTLTGFNKLPEDMVYEGWVIIDGEAVSTGTFDGLDEGINPVKVMAFDGDVSKIEKFVVSIEPKDDNDPKPSITKFVAGNFDQTSNTAIAKLTFDLGDAAGSTFILKTPSDGDMTNENSGIWFLSVPNPTSTLNLPVLEEGWKYEGWAVVDGKPYSSGKFSDPKKADDDGNPYKADGNVPPLPGEDFLQGKDAFPLKIGVGSSIVISIEPEIEAADDTNPFFFKPLSYKLTTEDEPNEDLNTENFNLNYAPLTVSAVAKLLK